MENDSRMRIKLYNPNFYEWLIIQRYQLRIKSQMIEIMDVESRYGIC